MIKLAGPLTRLEAAVKERGAGAYVVTASADGRPHVTYAPVRWDGEGLAAEVGRATALNAQANPTVTVLFPVRSARRLQPDRRRVGGRRGGRPPAPHADPRRAPPAGRAGRPHVVLHR